VCSSDLGSTLLLGFLMFYTTLRRYAVGAHGPWLPLHPAWSPPGSILLVVALYLIGAALVALTVLGSRPPDHPEPPVDGTGLPTPTEVAAVVDEAEASAVREVSAVLNAEPQISASGGR